MIGEARKVRFCNQNQPLERFNELKYKAIYLCRFSLYQVHFHLAGKTKLKCYSNAKSNERVQDALLDCKLGRGKVLSDRELVKLEGKRKKSGEQLRKSDLDYYSASLKAERAR